MALRSVTVHELTIDDERSVAHVDLYRRLKDALMRSGHRFLIPEDPGEMSWDRALFLNLTYWTADRPGAPGTGVSDGDGGGDGRGDGDGGGGDVLCSNHIAADEIGHVAWHHVVSRELARQATPDPTGAGPPSAEALFFSESIASAFDLYLIGRLLRNAPDSDLITTQVPLIAERAEDAGLSRVAFSLLLEDIWRDPERAFEDMRALLMDVSNALLACRSASEAGQALATFVGHRFEPLLHHFEISNWILYARAYGTRAAGPDAVVRGLDALLRQAPDALGWLADHWIDADLGKPAAR